jgi:hypothetical protein
MMYQNRDIFPPENRLKACTPASLPRQSISKEQLTAESYRRLRSRVLIFLVLAMSPFSGSVAGAETSKLTGILVEGGVVCPLVRSASGQTISLVGLPRDTRVIGRRVELTGSYLRESQCQQGDRTFQVTSAKFV